MNVSDESYENCIEEVSILSFLDHPNVLKVI